MRTLLARPSWMSVRFLPPRWRFYCRADIVRSTASLWILLGEPFHRQDLDGNGSKRFVTLSMGIYNSIISKLVPIVPHSRLFGSEWGFAATSRTWQSRSAAASTFQPGTQPVIWGT